MNYNSCMININITITNQLWSKNFRGKWLCVEHLIHKSSSYAHTHFFLWVLHKDLCLLAVTYISSVHELYTSLVCVPAYFQHNEQDNAFTGLLYSTDWTGLDWTRGLSWKQLLNNNPGTIHLLQHWRHHYQAITAAAAGSSLQVMTLAYALIN